MLKINFAKSKIMSRYLLLVLLVVIYSIYLSGINNFFKLFLTIFSILYTCYIFFSLNKHKSLWYEDGKFKLLFNDGMLCVYHDMTMTLHNNHLFIINLLGYKNKKILIFRDELSNQEYIKLNSRLIGFK